MVSMYENCTEVSNRAQVWYFLFCLVVVIGVHYGTGRHTADLSAPDISMAMEVSLHQ
jgi:hypothetical protein